MPDDETLMPIEKAPARVRREYYRRERRNSAIAVAVLALVAAAVAFGIWWLVR